MSVDQNAKNKALRELENLRQFIESGEVTFVVGFGKKDNRCFHFGGTTGAHRPPAHIMNLVVALEGLATDLRHGQEANSLYNYGLPNRGLFPQ